jgi:hypothetical protein
VQDFVWLGVVRQLRYTLHGYKGVVLIDRNAGETPAFLSIFIFITKSMNFHEKIGTLIFVSFIVNIPYWKFPLKSYDFFRLFDDV